jgi:NTE family protein
MSTPKKIALALQGTGAYGAFTWGVLARLLEEPKLEIAAISATGSSALNALLIAYGLAKEGTAAAVGLLRKFWRKVSLATNYALMLNPPLFGRNSAVHIFSDWMSLYLSPYKFSPYDSNAIGPILANLVDFEFVRKLTYPQIFIAAANVSKGKIAYFQPPELTLEMVLAGNYLPGISKGKAIRINDDEHWDGGFLGAPSLIHLMQATECQDIILVHNMLPVYNGNTLHIRAVPDRIHEFTFHTGLLREMQYLKLINELLPENKKTTLPYRKMFVHLISAEKEFADFNANSRFNCTWPFLIYLHGLGFRYADAFLQQHRDAIGKRSTFEIES